MDCLGNLKVYAALGITGAILRDNTIYERGRRDVRPVDVVCRAAFSAYCRRRTKCHGAT